MIYRDSPFQTARPDEAPLPALQGRTAIVAGAGSDIGRRIALLFAREGANVIVADAHGTAGEETVAAIEAADGRACLYPGNVMDPKYHLGLAAFARHRYGWLDIAVNNAWISSPPKRLAGNPHANWGDAAAANLSAALHAVRAQIPPMIAAGGGVIVNLAGTGAAGARSASTQGLIGLTKDIAAQYSGQGIRANVIVPSCIDAGDCIEMVGEIAQVALFLACPKSRFINGVCLPVSGAKLAQ
jgi:NAD(P)-dependent dehydrogenase (short-subunit alcohol dehydrogenase family)